MDLPLWDPLDAQSYLTQPYISNFNIGDGRYCDYSGHRLVESRSSYYIEGHGHCDFSFDYMHDIIEEDALNEKYCMQVLKIMIDKADEEIIELEEDIVMLQCQLAWDDENWSKPCSIILKERINHLDFLIQILKSEFTKEAYDFSVKVEEHGILHQKLHNVVKPQLDNYLLAKSKQVLSIVLRSANCVDVQPSNEQLESSLVPICALPAVGSGRKKKASNTTKLATKVEAKKRINLMGKTMSRGPKEKKTNNPKQKSIAKKSPIKKSQKKKEIRGMKSHGRCRKTAQMASPLLKCVEIVEMGTDEKEEINVRKSIVPSKYGKDELLVKDTNKLNRQVGRQLPKSFLLNPVSRSSVKLEEPSNTTVKDTYVEVISKEKVIHCEFEHESEVIYPYLESQEMELKIAETIKPADVILDTHLTCVKQITGEFSESPKDGHFINTKLISQKPVVKKRNRANFPESTEALEAQATETMNTDSVSLQLFGQKKRRASKPKMKVESKFLVQQIQEIEASETQAAETKNTNSDSHFELFGHKSRGASKPKKKMENRLPEQQLHDVEIIVMKEDNLDYSLKQECQEPEKTCEQDLVIAQKVCLREEIDLESSCLETVKRQGKIGVLEMIGKKETQQESSWTKKDDASEVNIASSLMEENENVI